MQERLKYVTARPSLANPKRWYWQRPGHDLVRLPDDPVLRFAKVQQLNQEADGQSELIHGSVGWVVDQYRQSDDYAALSPGTLKYYDRFLNDIEGLLRNLPFKDAMTRRVAVDFVRRYKKSMQRQAAAVVFAACPIRASVCVSGTLPTPRAFQIIKRATCGARQRYECRRPAQPFSRLPRLQVGR